jgi:predicted SprT family Zn-dependent metalloprotease
MDECVYFTRRSIGENFNGKAMAWVFKEKCPKCKKGIMGKPRDDKTGGVKIRAKEYACPECKNTIEKGAYEVTLTTNIVYTCPFCNKSGETTAPYTRKTFEGVKAIVFECQSCHKKLGVTKKMKAPKKKSGPVKAEEADDDDDF